MRPCRVFYLGVWLAIFAIAGCGRTEVVDVDRSNSLPSGDTSYSRGPSAPAGGAQRAANDNAAPGGTADRDSRPGAPATNGGSPSAGPSGPVNLAGPGASSDLNVPTDPAGAPVDPSSAGPALPPSDFRVALASDRTLDINELLERECSEFEERLTAIAEGGQMLRTYYTNAAPGLTAVVDVGPAARAPQAATAPAPGVNVGPAGAPPTVPAANPNPAPPLDPAGAVPVAAPADRPPAAFSGRRPRRPSRGRPGPPDAPGQPGAESSTPFMYIGRIAATLRGPTAAYYRDGTPMIYSSYDRDSKRDGTLISWDEQGRPVVIDQFSGGRRTGLRVLFRPLSDSDPTGRVALVQEWRAGRLSATHLVADDGTAETFEPNDAPLDEASEELADRLAELDEFDETLVENEQELRKALTELNRNELRAAKAAKRQNRAQAAQSQSQILRRLTSGIRSPGEWRRGRRR